MIYYLGEKKETIYRVKDYKEHIEKRSNESKKTHNYCGAHECREQSKKSAVYTQTTNATNIYIFYKESYFLNN